MAPDSVLILKIVSAALIFIVGTAGAYSAIKVQGSGRSNLLSIGNCSALPHAFSRPGFPSMGSDGWADRGAAAVD